MADGTRTADLPLASALDTVLGNVEVDGILRTRRQAMANLANQLLTTPALSGLVAGGPARVYANRAALYADLTPAANVFSWVLLDPTPEYNGIYQKVGGTGTGSHTRVADLPYSFIRAYNIGAGSANAIVATTAISLPTAPYAAEILLTATHTNTGATTLNINGTGAKALVTNSGSALSAGYITPGMILNIVDTGTQYRLTSDVASSSIQAAAEAALNEFLRRFPGAFANSTAAEAFLTSRGLTKAAGTIFFNTTSGILNKWTGSAWEAFDPAAPADGSVGPTKIMPGYALRRKLPPGETILYCNFSSSTALAGPTTSAGAVVLQPGNDATADGTPGLPFKHVSAAMYYAINTFDWNGIETGISVVVIRPADNVLETDNQGVHWSPHGYTGAAGGRGMTLRAGPGSGIVIASGGRSCFEFYWSTVKVEGPWELASTNNIFSVNHGAMVYVQDVRLLQAGPSSAGFFIDDRGCVEQTGDIYMGQPGSTLAIAYPVLTDMNAVFRQMSYSLVLRNNVTVNTWARASDGSIQRWNSITDNGYTSTGAATKFAVLGNAFIRTPGKSTFFNAVASTAGTETDGGLCV